MNVIQRGISNSYSAIMDPSVSPLRNLPSSQRFQAMMALSMMWTQHDVDPHILCRHRRLALVRGTRDVPCPCRSGGDRYRHHIPSGQ